MEKTKLGGIKIAEEKPKKESVKEDFEIVSELPQQPVKKFVDEDGKEVTIYTISEALKEMLVILRKLDKTF